MEKLFLKNTIENIGWFDGFFSIIMIYSIIQCVMRGFTLSFISFMKWIVALILTIILLPKLQPWVSEYIESPFINDIGLCITVYVIALFLIILIGKAITSSVKWTGFGPMDKTFGLFFGLFKGWSMNPSYDCVSCSFSYL